MKLWFAAQLFAITLSGASSAGPGQVPLGIPKAGTPSTRTQPNIVFIITDDQDLHLGSLDYLPHIKRHLIDQGLLYKRHYCTTAVCCPSRVSLWTGKQAHNTNVTDVNPPYGGYPKFVKQGLNEAYLPVWLQDAGYNTFYTGKLFNAHTVENYNSPYVAGWTGSDFLLDPFTYMYLNATFQRNRDAPVSYEGQHSVDVLAQKALGFLDEAAEGDRPFFLAIAPVAPHSNVEIKNLDRDLNDIMDATFSAPIPAKRHENLFKDVKVPRTDNFNPDRPSGANWVRRLPQQSQANVDYNDHFYRQRLRTLQGVDELVDGVFQKLEEQGILDNTYVFYTTDNGYHIGQHRLQPGKECGFEEDINIPLVVRGPGVPSGEVADVVTTHVDLAPTILRLAGAPIRADFDGDAIPLSQHGLEEAEKFRHEHVTVEYWGFAAAEGDFFDGDRVTVNNTYKALRIISKTYNFYYSVWCNNEHELYDLRTDPQQLNNLLHADDTSPQKLLGLPFKKALHPAGNVQNLHDALAPRFDHFYETQQKQVRYDRCELGYIIDAEGPQFERHGVRWDEWV